MVGWVWGRGTQKNSWVLLRRLCGCPGSESRWYWEDGQGPGLFSGSQSYSVAFPAAPPTPGPHLLCCCLWLHPSPQLSCQGIPTLLKQPLVAIRYSCQVFQPPSPQSGSCPRAGTSSVHLWFHSTSTRLGMRAVSESQALGPGEPQRLVTTSSDYRFPCSPCSSIKTRSLKEAWILIANIY